MKVVKFSKFFGFSWFLSSLFIVAGFVFVYFSDGFKKGIDFSSGFLVRLNVSVPSDVQSFKACLAPVLGEDIMVQEERSEKGEESSFLVKGKVLKDSSQVVQTLEGSLIQAVSSCYPQAHVKISEISLIDPSFSRTLIYKTFWLVVGVLGLILLYIWLRFQLVYAVASVVALIHNVLAVLAFIAFAGIEISIPVVVSLLTIVGYSLNDTIVIFDRVRENLGRTSLKSVKEQVDESLTQTLSRTLITSLTTLLAILMVAIFTQGTVKDFAVSFIVGIIIGTYSSLLIASSLLTVWLTKLTPSLKKQKKMSPPKESLKDSNIAFPNSIIR